MQRFGTLRSGPASTTCPGLPWLPQLKSKSKSKCPLDLAPNSKHDARRLGRWLHSLHKLRRIHSLSTATAHPQRLNIAYTIGVCMSVMKQWLLSEPCSLAWQACAGGDPQLCRLTPLAPTTTRILLSEPRPCRNPQHPSHKALDVNLHTLYLPVRHSFCL